MKCSIALTALFTGASVTAIPLLPRLALPQSYSVVPVDGGSSAIPATVTQTAVITSLATMVVTQSESVTTIVVPQTVTVMAGPNATPTITLSESVSSSAYDNGQWHTTYYAKSTALIPVAAASTGRNGPPVPEVTSSPSASRAVHSTWAWQSAVATTPAVPDPGSWRAWSDRGNSGMWKGES